MVAEHRGATSALGKIYLMEKAANSDTITKVSLIAKLANTLKDDTTGFCGAAAGDVDGSGKISYMLGSYGTTATKRHAKSIAIFGLKYLGGDITSESSYFKYVVDTITHKENNGGATVMATYDLDGNNKAEVLWTSTYPWGSGNWDTYTHPITVLENKIGILVGNERVSTSPKSFTLEQNYPNPFNPTTNIRFSIPENSFVSLKVYNILGQEVATIINQDMKAGSYKYDFNATKLASGAYIYKIQAGSYSKTMKMMLVK